MATIPLTFKVGNFPINFSGSPLAVFKAMLRRMRAYLSDKDILLGKSTTVAPTYDIGLHYVSSGYADVSYLRYWDQSKGSYAAIIPATTVGNYTLRINNDGAAASSTLTLPDKSGIALLVLDSIVPRATVLISNENVGNETTPTIQWTSATDPYDGKSSNTYLQKLVGNTTYTFSSQNNGQHITVTLQNDGTAFTTTWPGTVKWQNGHVMPISTGAGIIGVGRFEFVRINGTTYGILGDFTPGTPSAPVNPGGSDNISPNYVPPADRMKFPY